MTREIVQTMFLLLGWDERQALKRMLKDRERRALRHLLEGEPNW